MMLRIWSHHLYRLHNIVYTVNLYLYGRLYHIPFGATQSKSWVITSDGVNQIFAVSNAISPDHITDSNSWNIKLEKDGYEKFVPVWKANSDPWNLTIDFNFECVEGDGFPIADRYTVI